MAFVFIVCYNSILPWGFHAHKEVNFHACFTLPPEMFGFYKANIDLIRSLAGQPDLPIKEIQNMTLALKTDSVFQKKSAKKRDRIMLH